MNVNVRASRLGYTRFRVNDRAFSTYSKAQRYSLSLMGKQNHSFDGYNNKTRQWECFYMEIFNMTPWAPSNIDEELQRCNDYIAVAQL